MVTGQMDVSLEGDMRIRVRKFAGGGCLRTILAIKAALLAIAIPSFLRTVTVLFTHTVIYLPRVCDMRISKKAQAAGKFLY
jgi:hypothetical protein